jgi:hypothetical protein
MTIENPVPEAYKYVHTNPDFLKDSGLEMPDIKITALDTFAVPKNLVENEKEFLEWFEPRFFKLDEAGIKEFSELCNESLKIINEHKYFLSPRKGRDYPLSPSVAQRISSGFTDLSEIRNFFGSVSIDDSSKTSPEKFFHPDRGSDKGAIRLSICRILTLARLLEGVKKSHNLEAFLENSRSVLGRSSKDEPETGILSSLVVPGNLEILDKPEGKIHILDWLEKSQVFKGCNIGLGGPKGRRHYYVPEVHIGLKGGLRSFLKIARDPEAEFNPLDDFLRLRFLYEDNADLSTIMDLIHDLQEEAKTKKHPITKIEIKARNYFTKEELAKYLPDRIGESEELADDQETDMALKKKSTRTGSLRRGAGVTKETRTGDFLNQVAIYKNNSSGKNYKNITVKIYLHRPDSEREDEKEERPFFGFEIQLMRKKELIANEEIERHSSHFLFEMRQAAELISRENGSLNENELTRLLKNYLAEKKTEDFPSVLLGDAKYPDKSGSKNLEVDYGGTLDKKAKDLFKFLVDEGTLRHVAPNFPTEKVPKRETRINSGLYLHKDIVTRILESLGHRKK